MKMFSTHRILWLSGCAAAAAFLTVAQTGAKSITATGLSERHGPETYTIGLFGDTPYNTLGRAQYPALLAVRLSVRLSQSFRVAKGTTAVRLEGTI